MKQNRIKSNAVQSRVLYCMVGSGMIWSSGMELNKACSTVEQSKVEQSRVEQTYEEIYEENRLEKQGILKEILLLSLL